MMRLAEQSIRLPKRTLAFWLIVTAALAFAAFGIRDVLAPSQTVIPGTQSARAEQMARDQFGPSVLVPILLRGPAVQLDAQGPKLAAALRKNPDTKVLSAWDPQQGEALRPEPGAAMVVASVAASEAEMVKSGQDRIQRTVDATITGGVRAAITGQPSIDLALRDASLDATLRGGLVALPILLLLLVAVLRRPIAALAVTAFAALSTLAGIGVLALLARLVDTDPIAVAAGALTAIGLGGVYAMTVTQRFVAHDIVDLPAERASSAALTRDVVRLSGRGIVVGGTAFVLALAVASRIAPSDALTSVGIGALVCGAVGLALAVLALPAALVLLGRRLDALAFAPPREPHASPDQRLVTKHAGVAGLVATLALGLLALPVLSIETGPPDIAQLPADSQARKDFQTIADTMGPGWATPFAVTVVARNRVITSRSTLTQIADFQKQIARDPRVASVAGPGAFVAQTADLRKLPAALDDSKKLLTGGKQDLRKLNDGLGEAGAGALQLRAGLVDATAGANQLSSGGGSAKAGAAKLHAGLASARAGARKISRGLGDALTGAESLRNGAGQALAGATLVNANLGAVADPVTTAVPQAKAVAGAVQSGSAAVAGAAKSNAATAGSLDTAITALEAMGVGKTDSGYAATLAAARAARSSAGTTSGALAGAGKALAAGTVGTAAIAGQIAQLSSALGQLHEGAGGLQTGIAKLQKGNTDLTKGLGQLNSGGKDLTSGLGQLTTGAGSLETGLGRLSTGAGALAVGLQGAVGPTGTLAAGLDTMHKGVGKFSGSLPSPKDLERLQASSPGLFNSGYFVLAAISGAPAAERNVASFALNIARGGNAGQIVVISKTAVNTAATHDLSRDLQAMTGAFAEKAHLDAAVGGPAGNLTDYRAETASRIAPAIAGVALAVALLLMLMLRSILIPLVATASVLLAAAATFGLMKLLFQGDDPLLGGPGYIDPMSIIAVFTAAFGLSSVFAGILLDEVRQEFLACRDLPAAVEAALRRSARAGAAAGLVVAVAAIPFALHDLLNLRQFAVGMGLVAIIDVLLMRALLLPAAIEVLRGPAWWPTAAQQDAERTAQLPARPLPH